MDVHPTPYPGKRRSVANPAAKDAARTKPSKKAPPPQALTTAQTRPPSTRAFGVPRSTNIPAEKPLPKPLSAKTCKPWKPSGASKNPAQSTAPAVAAAAAAKGKPSEDAAGGSNSNKTKADAKKHRHVSFEEPETTIQQQEDGAQTPARSIAPAAAQGTPYLSAQNCSHCRLDKLESAAYWLAQIELAETVGKHSVAAAFFRLALECRAQPFHRLQRDLKHYMARHQAQQTDSLWEHLCQAYGLPEDRLDAFSSSIDQVSSPSVRKEDCGPPAGCDKLLNRVPQEDGCLDCGGIDHPKANVSETTPTVEGVDVDDAQLEDSDTNTAGREDNFIQKEFGNAEVTLDSAEEFLSESKNFEAANISTDEQKDNTNENADPVLSKNFEANNISTDEQGNNTNENSELTLSKNSEAANITTGEERGNANEKAEPMLSKNVDATNTSTGEHKENTDENADLTLVNSSGGFLPQNKTCGSTDVSHGSNKKSSEASDSERNSSKVRSNAGMASSSESLASSTKSQGSGGSVNSGKTTRKNKAGPKFSAGEPTRCDTSGARIGRNGQGRSKGRGDQHSSRPQISANINSEVSVEDGAANQSI